MIEIRSFRRVFDLERRIYRVDRLRLNPGGIPVRGIVYFVALLVASLLAAATPVLSLPLDALPWYLRSLLLPALIAAALTAIRLEGRPFHTAAQALLRYAFGPSHLTGFDACAAPGSCWRPGELLLVPDGSDGRLRRFRYTGPGAVLIAIPYVREEGSSRPRGPVRRWRAARRAVVVREASPARAAARGQVIALARGSRLRTRA